MLDLPPDIAFVLFVSLVAVFAVITSLLMHDKQAEHNLMLTKRIEKLETELMEWVGVPRKLLENDLSKKVVIN